MNDEAGMACIAHLFADAARARILKTLMDGTMRPAGELAYAAGISAQSASAHLAKLVDGGLLVQEAHGRHRYFRLAGSMVAEALESLDSLSESVRPRDPRSPALPKATPNQFLHARTCYDHLAGRMAVQVCESMQKAGWLRAADKDFHVTRLGEKSLAAMGLDLDHTRGARRALARACVDLTQRRPHLGGALGAALLDHYVKQGWILRSQRSRAVDITPKGSAAFRKVFI